ncbi:hypothetical protein C6501_15520 [Candidatus Poribacteria bacterium]|nr:MAG: hypothetical protein C6501_15520 [Candidatus Poribacteria bacterium]
MTDKYDSTDFWYTFINSLYNEGLSLKSGISEIDEEMQEKLLAYFRTKIEEGITDGETALPPRLSDYCWRLPQEMLPKLRALAEGFLDTDPDNGPAAVLLATVAYTDLGREESLPFVEKALTLVPKDPCLNLLMIYKYRRYYGGAKIVEAQETILTVLENVFEWSKRQDNSARFQDARSFYFGERITPYSVYTNLKSIEARWKKREKVGVVKKCKEAIEKCRILIYTEQETFRREAIQAAVEQPLIVDESPENVNFWEAFLDSLIERGLSTPRWVLTKKVQDQLLKYFKTRIEEGVTDGLTTLPLDLPEYVPRFPKAMHLELREFAEEMLEKQPENGAAAKVLAIVVEKNDNFLRLGNPFIEQAVPLVPNDPEICFFAISSNRNFDELSLLEKLFDRAQSHGKTELSHWLAKLYKEVGTTPCHIYRNLMKKPDENAELIKRCKLLIDQAQQAFQQRLEEEPDDWYALRGLGDIYEVLGETELAQKYPWKGHPNIETVWNQKAWVGRKLPDFSATTHDDTSITASDYKGKLLLLSFCAEWCGFCASEIPYIKEAYKEHHHNGFEVIGISLDKNEAELKEYIEEHNITWPQIYDGKGWNTELARYFGIICLPSQWLIDRDGTILSVGTRGKQLGQLVKWTETTRVGNAVPDFSAVDIDGKHVSLSVYRGKVVLLYFGYSEQEITCVDTIYQKYHTKGFEVICVNFGMRDEDILRSKISERNHQGHHIYGGSRLKSPLAQQFGLGQDAQAAIVELPAYILIDNNGRVIEARSGKVHSPEAWAARLEELVATHL